MATMVTSRTMTNCATHRRTRTMRPRVPGRLLPSNSPMPETSAKRPPTTATMRLDGGHAALDLANTVYGQHGEPPEHDVLETPADLVTFARRVGLASAGTPASAAALRIARELRDALAAVLDARLAGERPPPAPRAALEQSARAALAAGRLEERDGALAWSWPDDEARSPVHRLAVLALELLASEPDLARLRRCAGC